MTTTEPTCTGYGETHDKPIDAPCTRMFYGHIFTLCHRCAMGYDLASNADRAAILAPQLSAPKKIADVMENELAGVISELPREDILQRAATALASDLGHRLTAFHASTGVIWSAWCKDCERYAFVNKLTTELAGTALQAGCDGTIQRVTSPVSILNSVGTLSRDVEAERWTVGASEPATLPAGTPFFKVSSMRVSSKAEIHVAEPTVGDVLTPTLYMVPKDAIEIRRDGAQPRQAIMDAPFPAPMLDALKRIQASAETYSSMDWQKSKAHQHAQMLANGLREISDLAIEAMRAAGAPYEAPTSAEVEADVSESLKKPYTGPQSRRPEQG